MMKSIGDFYTQEDYFSPSVINWGTTVIETSRC